MKKIRFLFLFIFFSVCVCLGLFAEETDSVNDTLNYYENKAIEGQDYQIDPQESLTGAPQSRTVEPKTAAGGEEIIMLDSLELKDMDMGAPPHCLIVPGNLHFTEEEALERFKV